MSQRPTTHPPLHSAPDLSWQEQVLMRLDEIIGLLDDIATTLSVLSNQATAPFVVNEADADPVTMSAKANLLALCLQQAEEPEP